MTSFGKAINSAVRTRIRELIRTGEIKLVFTERDNHGAGAEYLRELAAIKRLLERWSADARFRAQMTTDPRAAARQMNLSIDPIGLESLWDEAAARTTPAHEIPLAALRFNAFLIERTMRTDRIRAGSPTSDPRFSAWRRRQIQRVDMELLPSAARGMAHISCAIELGQGCSVGCWFCAVSAPRLEDIFPYNQENAALFGGAISALIEIFGDFAGQGICYWATDPMDNPDYEMFILDFHRLTGRFPQTTTALALKDITRTRALLELSRRSGGVLDRFSVLTLEQLDQLYAAFTPEELLYVGLVPVNKESQRPKLRAGRALLRKPSGDGVTEGTGACVSGFLLNMVRRTVKLISPCLPSERWPLGYIIFEEGRFRDTAELRAILHRMVDTHMRIDLRGDDPIAFHDHLSFEELPDGFRLKGRHISKRFADGPLLTQIGRAVHAGSMTVDEILDLFSDADALHALRLMLDAGVLDTRPAPMVPDARGSTDG